MFLSALWEDLEVTVSAYKKRSKLQCPKKIVIKKISMMVLLFYSRSHNKLHVLKENRL